MHLPFIFAQKIDRHDAHVILFEGQNYPYTIEKINKRCKVREKNLECNILTSIKIKVKICQYLHQIIN